MNNATEKLLNDDKEQYLHDLEDELEDEQDKPTKIWCLGGIDEIGKNMYCVKQSNEIFIVDCGIKFADEDLPGVGGLICPFDSLIVRQDYIKGLIVTHGHEDHIGGIPYLLMSIKKPFPIYGAKLTIELIKKRLHEFKNIPTPTFVVIEDDSKIQTQEFEIEFFRVCHSIPDAFGVYMKTKNATIIESGDFKFDFSTKGDEFNILKAAEFGKQNIDVLLCESTNAETHGFAASEKEVIDELKTIITTSPGRVFVSTFASNLQRIEEIIELGIQCGRKICLFGRSMNSNISISMDIGLLNVSENEFVDPADVKNLPDEQVLILCTGSQGEELAALNQMAIGRNAYIVFKPTDTVILSSNPIPGNFESVEQLVNRLYMKGVRVKTNSKESKLHSSGHATQMEQQLLFKLINPQFIIPIHGEYKMLRALKQNAIDSGFHPDNVIQIAKGQIVEILNHKIKTTQNFVDIYDVFVNNGKIDDDSTATLKYRKVLSRDGIFCVTILLDFKSKEVIGLPAITTRGAFFVKESQALMGKIAYTIRDKIKAYLAKTTNINVNIIRHIISNTSLFFIWSNKRKRPIIKTTIFDINTDMDFSTTKDEPESNIAAE